MTPKKKPTNVMLRFRTQSGLEKVRRAARLADQSLNKWAIGRLERVAEAELEQVQAKSIIPVAQAAD